MLSFAHLWQQDELSDVDVLLTAPSSTHQQGAAPPQKLAEFPGHTVLLSSSPYLKAQILRWHNKRPHERATGVSTRSRAASSSSPAQQAQQPEAPVRPQLVLTLLDASQKPAAMAVLAALYGTNSTHVLLSELSQEQQLQAAMLADMWQLAATSTAAGGALSRTLRSDGKLSDSVTQQLLTMQAVPVCLQPLLQPVLLSVLGNLEQCWANSTQKDRLLNLPLHSMELLLSSDKLEVASEDTVLYTVQQYMDSNSDDDDDAQKQIQEHSGPLIRCQHLSHYWLLLSAVSESAGSRPLAQLQPQLKQLLMLRSSKARVTAAELKSRLKDVPASWLLGQRRKASVSTVELTWELDIGRLREAAQRSAAEQEVQFLTSPGVTPPLGGMAFDINATCNPNKELADSGVSIGVWVRPDGVPSDASCSFTFELCAPGASIAAWSATIGPIKGDGLRGVSDYFEVGPMAGGWDEAAWAAKGLPASGCLVLKLSVSKVGHMGKTPR